MPIIGAGLYLRRAQLATFIPHAIVMVIGILLVAAFTEASQNMGSLRTIMETLPLWLASLLRFDVGYSYAVPVILAIVAILAGVAVGPVSLPGLIRSGSPPAVAILSGSVFMVLVYLALYLASDRFKVGNISGRFFTPMVAFAILALTASSLRAPWLAALEQRLQQFGRTRAHGLLAVWLVLSLGAGPAIFWKYYESRLQFLAAAQCVRESGLSGVAIAAEANEYTLALADGHFDPSSSTLAITDLRPSFRPLAELQRLCPGIQPSYIEAVRSARIWVGAKVF